MGRLESSDVSRVLKRKMKAEQIDRPDWFYKIYDEEGVFVSSTSISKGSKETLSDKRVSVMAHQLGLSTSQQFIDLIKCTLSREDALKIMKTNLPPGTPRKHN